MDLLKYNYQYITESSFVPPVEHHFFKMRALPMENACQHILTAEMTVSPQCQLNHSKDGYGNSVQCGSFSEPHNHFRIESRGVVECSAYCIPDASPKDFYLYPTRLTEWNKDIAQLASSGNALDIMHAIYGLLTYERFATDNSTTAIDTFSIRKGVCQDYAHLMIAACRSAGLKARYVNGLMLGEGETHAWVEVHDGEKWLGYDPTHDCQIDYGYIKFAHGRDVADCPSNRGRFYGWTMETMTVTCKLIKQEN